MTLQAQLVSRASKKTAKHHTASTGCSLACSSSDASTQSTASDCAAVASDSAGLSASTADANAAPNCIAQASCSDPHSQGAKGSAAQAAAADKPKDTVDRAVVESAAGVTIKLGTLQCKATCTPEVPEQPCTSSTAQTASMQGAMPLQCAAVVVAASCDSLPESDSQKVLAAGSDAASDQTQPDNNVYEPNIDTKNKGMACFDVVDRYALA